MTSRGFFNKIFSWQAKQSIPHTTVTFNGDCMKLCKNFAPNVGEKKNWLLHHNNASSHSYFFTSEFLTETT
jgi:hypothetical protein